MAGRLSFQGWREWGVEFPDHGRTEILECTVIKIGLCGIDQITAAKARKRLAFPLPPPPPALSPIGQGRPHPR